MNRPGAFNRPCRAKKCLLRNLKFTLLILVQLLLALCPAVYAQGTAFTYQGRLNASGSPASGLYDFQFALASAPVGGSPLSGTITNLAVTVTNGLFNTTLDFGSAFTGNATWLAISVRTNGLGAYAALSPLQALTPAPYAIFAGTAGSVIGNVTGNVTGNVSGSSATALVADNFTGPLAGDVTGTQAATVVVSVGGQTAATVAAGSSAANAATSANVPGTIVARDATGNFSAGAISATTLSGDGSALTNLNGASLAANSVTPTQLAPGAAVANLNTASQSAVPSGGMVLSATPNTALLNAGYVKIGTVSASDAWEEPVTAGAPSARYGHTAVWTGTEMIVWGGYYGGAGFADGGRYNPAANSWIATSTTGAPAARYGHTAVWTGSSMLVWGGYANGYYGDGAGL